MAAKTSRRRCTIPFRLTDVIRLITVLALDKNAFTTLNKLNDSIRGEPLSAISWEAVAIKHPEFFRPNFNGKYIALLMRSYLPVEGDNDKRNTLSIGETQKLIDVAISLHQKEIQRFQRNSYLFPLVVATIAFLGVVTASIDTNQVNNKAGQKLDSLTIICEG